MFKDTTTLLDKIPKHFFRNVLLSKLNTFWEYNLSKSCNLKQEILKQYLFKSTNEARWKFSLSKLIFGGWKQTRCPSLTARGVRTWSLL